MDDPITTYFNNLYLKVNTCKSALLNISKHLDTPQPLLTALTTSQVTKELEQFWSVITDLENTLLDGPSPSTLSSKHHVTSILSAKKVVAVCKNIHITLFSYFHITKYGKAPHYLTSYLTKNDIDTLVDHSVLYNKKTGYGIKPPSYNTLPKLQYFLSLGLEYILSLLPRNYTKFHTALNPYIKYPLYLSSYLLLTFWLSFPYIYPNHSFFLVTIAIFVGIPALTSSAILVKTLLRLKNHNKYPSAHKYLSNKLKHLFPEAIIDKDNDTSPTSSITSLN